MIARLADPVNKAVVSHHCPTSESVICVGAIQGEMLRLQAGLARRRRQLSKRCYLGLVAVIAHVLKFTAARGPLNATFRSTVASAESAWK